MKRAIYARLAALTILVLSSTAEAGCEFNMFTIHNNSDVQVGYLIRWDNGEWQTYFVEPHSAMNHWDEINRREHCAEIRFDSASRIGDRQYSLSAYRGRDTCQGASYTFNYNGRSWDLTKDN